MEVDDAARQRQLHSSFWWTADAVRFGQRQTHDHLAVPVKFAGGQEPDPLIEPGRPAAVGHVAGQQLGRPLRADYLGDLPNGLDAVAVALVPHVNDYLPQEPRSDDGRWLRLNVPARHHRTDRLVPGVDRPVPRFGVRVFRGV